MKKSIRKDDGDFYRKLAILLLCWIISPKFYVSGFHRMAWGGIIELLLGGIFTLVPIVLLFWLFERVTR